MRLKTRGREKSSMGTHRESKKSKKKEEIPPGFATQELARTAQEPLESEAGFSSPIMPWARGESRKIGPALPQEARTSEGSRCQQSPDPAHDTATVNPSPLACRPDRCTPAVDTCAVYFDEMLEALRRTEVKHTNSRTRFCSFAESSDILAMRGDIVDAVYEHHAKQRLSLKTLLLALSVVDRVLSKSRIKNFDAQLVGFTCLFTAAKYFELDTPDFNVVTRLLRAVSTKRRSQVLYLEKQVAMLLDFKLTVPTAVDYAEVLFVRLAGGKHPPLGRQRPVLTPLLARMWDHLCYRLELCALHEDVLRCQPSMVASTCLALAQSELRRAGAEAVGELRPLPWLSKDEMDHTANVIHKLVKHHLATVPFPGTCLSRTSFHRKAFSILRMKYGGLWE